jgi:hypothetical protein
MAVPAGVAAAFEVVEAEFVLELLVLRKRQTKGVLI